jgi:hypothetical protein
MELAFDMRLKVISEFQLPTSYTSSGPFSTIQFACWLHHRLGSSTFRPDSATFASALHLKERHGALSSSRAVQARNHPNHSPVSRAQAAVLVARAPRVLPNAKYAFCEIRRGAGQSKHRRKDSFLNTKYTSHIWHDAMRRVVVTGLGAVTPLGVGTPFSRIVAKEKNASSLDHDRYPSNLGSDLKCRVWDYIDKRQK